MTLPKSLTGRISLSSARQRLALTWSIGGGLVMLLVLLNTIHRHSIPPDPGDLWSWALAWIAPPLTAIFGCFAVTAMHQPRHELAVDRSFYHIVLAISIAEVFVLLALLSLEPFDTAFDLAAFARATKGWAAGWQGMLAIAMGGIFFKSKPDAATPKE